MSDFKASALTDVLTALIDDAAFSNEAEKNDLLLGVQAVGSGFTGSLAEYKAQQASTGDAATIADLQSQLAAAQAKQDSAVAAQKTSDDAAEAAEDATTAPPA